MKTPKDEQTILEQGQNGEFWRLILKYIDANVKHIEAMLSGDTELPNGQMMKDLPADEYKIQNEIFREKKSYLEKLKNLPVAIIESLNEPETQDQNLDVYRDP